MINAPCCCGSSSSAATDRFAPEIIVGNVPAGDPATAYTSDEFYYVPDTGNGAGIEAAIALLGAEGGTIYIRRGTYDFNVAGGPTGPITVPAKVSLVGAGRYSTVITGLDAGAQGVFLVNDGCAVRNMLLSQLVADAAGTGQAGVITGHNGCELENLIIYCAPSAASTLRACVAWTSSTNSTVQLRMDNCLLQGTVKLGAGTPSLGLSMVSGTYATLTGVEITGVDIGISSDRSYLRASALDITDFAVSAVLRTNSTASGTNAGDLLMSDFRFIADNTGGANVIDLTWGAARLTNGTIGTTSTAAMNAAIRFSDTTNFPSDMQVSEVNIDNCVWGFVLAGVSGIEISNVNITPTATGGVAAGGVSLSLCGRVVLDGLSVTYVRGAGYGVDVSQSSSVRIANSAFYLFGTSGAYGVRFRANGDCQITNSLIYTFNNGGNPLTAENAGVVINGCKFYSTDNTAVAQVRIINTSNVSVVGCMFTASSRNYGKIYVENSASCVINSNNIQSAVGQPGIVLDATSTYNQVVGNFCQGTTNGGVNPPVSDLGSNNNVQANYGS